tara:strand:+ start:184 stop:297 length:114 start_codon:yes stop_codon:yes gene_type:complete
MKKIAENTLGIIGIFVALYILLAIIKLGEMFAQFITG